MAIKETTIDGQTVVIIPQRGLGDGGLVVSYFVEEPDGTYSGVAEWWSDPVKAEEVADRPNDDHLRWAIGEARRQTIEKSLRPEPEPRPDPETGVISAEVLGV